VCCSIVGRRGGAGLSILAANANDMIIPPRAGNRPMKAGPMTDMIDRLSSYGIVPVVVARTTSEGAGIVDALAAGGLPVAEVTFRTEAAEDVIRAAARRGDILLGAGTVTTVDQVDRAVDAGADYIVSPGLSRAVVERAAHHGVPALPGTVTATEIQQALELGIRTVKFFPAETSGGAAAVKALGAPFGDVRFLPTGGIGPHNLEAYLGLDQVIAVGGSWMLPTAALDAGNWDEVSRLSAEAVALAARVRGLPLR
jgi:2-dehydro-3-deoxyphosphogluconate aldolase / (4S)-4-hydroxy-2-oxoglutarate aldolase